MNTPRILTRTIASLLLALPAFAVTDTWDGNSPNAGAGDSNVSTGLNWADDSAPLSDLVNTDLIFGGTTKLAPNFSTVFSMDSLSFINTAGAFVLGGSTITIGTSGIVNTDTQTQTINNNVTLGTAASSFQAISGALVFNGTLALGANSLAVGSTQTTTFAGAITGTGTINKSNTGTLTLSNTTISADVNISGGTVNVASAGTTIFNSNSTIAINGGTFDAAGNVTLDNAQLTRAAAATLNIAAGKTLTIQNGADAIITSAFFSSTASTIIVTGSGSTFTTSSNLNLSAGSTTNVLAGGSISAGSNGVDVGTGGTAGTVTVDAAGSSLAGGTLSVGQAGNTGILTFTNSSTGTFGQIGVDNSFFGGSSGTLSLQSGATVSGTGLSLASSVATNTGAVTITGASSALTLTGAATATIGATSLSTGALNVQNSGTFNSGTGLTTVNATGTIAIAGGTFNANGDLTLTGGQLTRDATGIFNFPAGKTLTIQSGGDANFTGTYTNSTAATFLVTDAGSTLSGNTSMAFNGGSIVNVQAGGSVSSGGGVLGIGTNGNGTMTVDGAGSNVSGSVLSVGGASAAANSSLTLSNTATATFSVLTVGGSLLPGTSAAVNIQSGATAAGGALSIGTNAVANASSVTINGAGSALTVTSGAVVIGASGANTTTLNVQSGGLFNSGTGATTVNATGTIAISGGTYNSGGNLTLAGGQLTRVGTGALNLALGTQMTVQNGGDAIITGAFQQLVRANLTVTGSGSTFSTIGDFQWEGGNSTLSLLSVSNGGVISSGGALHLGRTNTAVSMTVSGAGSLILASPFFTSEWQAGVLLTGGATANLGGLRIADTVFGSSSSGSLFVQSGSTALIGNLAAGSLITSATAEISVEGIGSAITQSGASTLTLGAAFATSATLSVVDSGAFTSGTGAFTMNATGVLNVGGGTASFNGPFTFNGGTVNFTSGALAFNNSGVNLTIGTGGFLGTGLTLTSDKQLTIGGTTTVDPFRTLTLNGGALTTSALVNNGTLDFQKGTLAITGAGGFTIGSGGALGASVTLGAGANLQVTNTATVASGATLTLNGGAFTAGTLANSGTLRANLGTASVGTVTNGSGGRIFVGDTLTTSGAWTNAAGATLTLENSGLVNGAGAIANSGLVTGDGTIAKPFTNASGGEVRGEFGKTLTFTGTNGANAGRLNLLGSTLQYTQQFTNSATGQINGQGALYFPTTPVPSSASPTAGLMNAGNINLTGGDSQIYGTVQMQAGSRLIVSGGATASFFDVFRHSGLDVKASVGSNIVFFGEVRGAGSFSGTGTIYFEGGYSPGNSPAAVTLGTGVVFGSANTLTLELGGLVAGSEYDQLILGASGSLALDGALVLDLIGGFVPHFGDTFQVLDFDPGQVSGSFDEITFADALPGDLTFDTSALSTTGKITVVPEPGIGALLASALALLGLQHRRLKTPAFRRSGTPNRILAAD